MIDVIPMNQIHINDVLVLEGYTNTSSISSDILLDELNNPTYINLVALSNTDEIVCGSTRGQVIADELHLYSVVVEPTYRGKGVAKELLAHLFLFAKLKNSTKCVLEVRPSNQSAIKLYEKLGFIEIARRKHYYNDNGEDAIIMTLEKLEISQ